jgi:sugar lactone lactonase YvrE
VLTGLVLSSVCVVTASTGFSLTAVAEVAGCPMLSGPAPVGTWSGEGSTAGSPGPSLSGTASYGAGVIGSAFVLAGSGMSSTSAPTMTEAVSVMAWVKPMSLDRVQTVVSRSTGPGMLSSSDVSHGYALRIGFPWGVEWEVDDPSTMVPEVLRASVFEELDDGNWHHVAASWEPGAMVVFVDGVEVARDVSRSASINPAASTPFTIGGELRTPFGFEGLIDEVILFDRPITASEIVSCVPAARTISTHAGNGVYGSAGDGGAAVDAELASVAQVAADHQGNVYIADGVNSKVRRVSPSGIITTVAGTGTRGFSGDGGPAIDAELNSPIGMTVDASGNLYIADAGNSRVRRVSPSGIITTVAGTGTYGFSGDGGPAADAQLRFPSGVAVDASGNLYIVDAQDNRVRRVTPNGTISTFAGTGTYGFSGDGGPASDADLRFPYGVAVDAIGNVYIADTDNYRLRKVSRSGIIFTIAGGGGGCELLPGGVFNSNARCPAINAYLRTSSVALDSDGYVYINDTAPGHNQVRMVSPFGTISGFAGSGFGFSGDGGPAINAQLMFPSAVAADGAGNVYIADNGNNRVRKVTAQP